MAKSLNELESMRAAGKLAALTLDHIGRHIIAGVSTELLDDAAEEFIALHNSKSACLGYTAGGNYPPFPKNICTSVNQVACHGIPNNKPLKEGDSLNVDVTVIVDGYHGDTSRMFFVGKPSIKHKRLSDATYEVMMRSIEILKPGVKISEIGASGEEIAKKYNLKVLRQFSGHGIGTIFHKEPSVINFVEPALPDWNYVLQEGEFITVEPILTTGKGEVKLLNDGWTMVTKDREPCAQWEHTVAITSNGYEIMTL